MGPRRPSLYLWARISVQVTELQLARWVSPRPVANSTDGRAGTAAGWAAPDIERFDCPLPHASIRRRRLTRARWTVTIRARGTRMTSATRRATRRRMTLPTLGTASAAMRTPTIRNSHNMGFCGAIVSAFVPNESAPADSSLSAHVRHCQSNGGAREESRRRALIRAGRGLHSRG